MPSDDAIARATAAFSDIFQLPGLAVGPDDAEGVEHGRLAAAGRPGLLRKLLPLRIDAHGVTSGGVYLFDTYEHAVEYGRWVAEELRVDGTLFYDLPIFMEPVWHAWELIGAEDFADVRTHQDVMRFERWHTLAPLDVEDLRARHWPAIRAAAEGAGLASVWLLYCPDEHHPQLGLVTVGAHEGGAPTGVAGEDLAALGSMPTLGAALADEVGATKVFDRTSWVFHIWFPLPAGGEDYEGSAVWPNSPPLPGVGA